MDHRTKILETRRTKLRHSNLLSQHEEKIALALEATSTKFDSVQQRLQNFQKKKKHANLRHRKHEWIEKIRDLEREESKISKQFDDISSSPHFLKAISITTHDKNSIEGKSQPRISIRKFCTEINSILSEPNARELLLAKTKNVKDRYNQIDDELKINRREEAEAQLQGSGNVFNDAKVKPSKTTNKIPTEVLHLVNAIKNEFLRIGLESKEITFTLETKLSQVISDLLASLSKPIHDRKKEETQNSTYTCILSSFIIRNPQITKTNNRSTNNDNIRTNLSSLGGAQRNPDPEESLPLLGHLSATDQGWNLHEAPLAYVQHGRKWSYHSFHQSGSFLPNRSK